jgi:hypothetical protein
MISEDKIFCLLFVEFKFRSIEGQSTKIIGFFSKSDAKDGPFYELSLDLSSM